MTFTPPPWEWVERDFGEGRVTANGDVIASVPTSGVEGFANLTLIAAAPAMFEAAKKALNYIENTESEFGVRLECGDALRAALKQAEGSQ